MQHVIRRRCLVVLVAGLALWPIRATQGEAPTSSEEVLGGRATAPLGCSAEAIEEWNNSTLGTIDAFNDCTGAPRHVCP